jgi:hypothetical protein
MTAEQVRETLSARVRPPPGLTKKHYFARIGAEEALAIGRLSLAATLLLDIIRLSGTRWVRQRDGWLLLNEATLNELGLIDKRARCRTVKRLVVLGFIEVRGNPGGRLEYRLKADWAKPKAEVVDLAAVRTDCGQLYGGDGRKAGAWGYWTGRKSRRSGRQASKRGRL